MWGCIPYTVGTTGQPLPAGEKSQAQSLYFIPNGLELFDSTATTFIGYDLELRFGIDGRSDVGLRLPGGMSGAIINYKYRLVGDEGGDSPAVALLTGVGMINWGNHLHFEAFIDCFWCRTGPSHALRRTEGHAGGSCIGRGRV